MKFEAFQKTELLHWHSGIDDDRPSTSGVGANYSDITGFTEWVSNSAPTITIGWDWKLTSVSGTATLIHAGIPGTNLMFLDGHDHDLGQELTRQLLAKWLGIFRWQPETLKAISILNI